jgi:hypothetical protein
MGCPVEGSSLKWENRAPWLTLDGMCGLLSHDIVTEYQNVCQHGRQRLGAGK